MIRVPVTRDLVTSLLTDLLTAWPYDRRAKSLEKTADLYLRALGNLPAEAVRWAGNRAIEDDEKFPTIARIRGLALEYQKRTSAPAAFVAPPAHPYTCSICGATAQHVEVTRFKREFITGPDGRGVWRFVLDAAGKHIRETVMSQGLVTIHDRERHGIVERAEVA